MPPSLPLATPRLLITPLTLDDAEAFAAYRSEPDVARYQSWEAPYPVAQARAALADNPRAWPAAGEWAQLGIRARDALLGDVAVHPFADAVRRDTVELGVTLAAAAQGHGFAVEALAAVVDACFAAGTHRVIAQCDARNAPVARLFARLGFRREAHEVQAEYWKGEWTTVDTWARLASEVPPPVSVKAVIRIGDAVLLGENGDG